MDDDCNLGNQCTTGTCIIPDKNKKGKKGTCQFTDVTCPVPEDCCEVALCDPEVGCVTQPLCNTEFEYCVNPGEEPCYCTEGGRVR